MTTGTQLQAHENAAAEEREDVELPLPLRACVNSEERSVDFKKSSSTLASPSTTAASDPSNITL